MPPKSRRKPAKPPRRMIIRSLVAVLTMLVFVALWLFDTGALLHLTRAEVVANPRATLAIVLGGCAIMAFSIWRAKRPKRRVAAKYVRKKPGGGR